MLVLAFVVLPVGAWLIWGNGSTLWLIIAYVICILLFGGLYYLFVIRNKQMHNDELKEISLLRDQRAMKKEAIDKILAIRTVAEGTIFKGTDLYLLDSIEVGEYEYGSELKRRVIERQLYGR